MFRTVVTAIAPVLLAAGLVVGGSGPAAAEPTSTGMSCGSANPLPWAPAFTWRIGAASGASRDDVNKPLQPSLLLSGGNELPVPPGGLIPSIGINWYGTRVQVDWHNRNTGASGRSFSDEARFTQHPVIPVNRTFTGSGTVDFTVTVSTGAGLWFINTQNAVCRGTISVKPV